MAYIFPSTWVDFLLHFTYYQKWRNHQMCNLNDLITKLDTVEDLRRTEFGNFKYSLSSIIGCSFCAVMAGYKGSRAIVDFIEDNFKMLNHFIGLPHGVPSHDTINRVLQSVDAQKLAEIFREWAGIDKLDPAYLHVDGKTIRGSKCKDQKAAHIVSVYAGDYAASICEEQVYEKQNEISAFERIFLANKINFSGKTVTGDAMFCQKTFCGAITNSGGNWIFVLKKNHPNLFASVEEYWAAMDATEVKVVPISGHGRKGKKTIKFTRDVDWILQDYDLTELRCMAEVTTEVIENGTLKTSTQYLIGSVKTLEELFVPRSKHWSIESMHWILDMAFEEDRCSSRTGNAPLTLNVFRKVAFYFFNLAKKLKQYKGHSIRRLMGRCKANFSHLLNVLTSA